MEPLRSEEFGDKQNVISPFAQSEVSIAQGKNSRFKIVGLIVLSLLLIIVGAALGVLGVRYINDPYRTLETFPVSKYFDGYQGLYGSKFKAEFRVEADLGWREKAGRLMLFSTEDDSRPIPVLIPVSVGKDIYFTKGPTYIVEIEVKEGGLIYANSCKKD